MSELEESDPARHDMSVLIRNIISLAIKIERMSSGNYKMESQEEKFFLRPVLLLGSMLICLEIRLIFKTSHNMSTSWLCKGRNLPRKLPKLFYSAVS